MSKLFKILGIGGAIGVVAYGVIKYKHDEKFKEKVDIVAEKVEEKTDKAMTKFSNFAAKHPGLTMVTVMTAIMVPGWIVSYAGAKQRQNMINNELNWYCEEMHKNGTGADSNEFKDILKNPSNYLIVSKDEWNSCQKQTIEECEPREEIFSNWDEKYRENWDEVNKFAKHLNLYSGEAFTIEDPSQFDIDSDHPIVSHLVDGDGCYPPETKINHFLS